jgi:hypothetical protein
MEEPNHNGDKVHLTPDSSELSILRVIAGCLLFGLPSLAIIFVGKYIGDEHPWIGQLIFFLGLGIVWAPAVFKMRSIRRYQDKVKAEQE